MRKHSTILICPIKKLLPKFDKPWLTHEARGCCRDMCLFYDADRKVCTKMNTPAAIKPAGAIYRRNLQKVDTVNQV